VRLGRRIEPVDLVPLDVDEPHGVADPHRAFAKHGADRENGNRVHHRHPAKRA
jgi:hypothetical protein